MKTIKLYIPTHVDSEGFTFEFNKAADTLAEAQGICEQHWLDEHDANHDELLEWQQLNRFTWVAKNYNDSEEKYVIRFTNLYVVPDLPKTKTIGDVITNAQFL